MVVSIVIPVFGVSEYIDRCVRSVMEQTYGDIECILVDDASPDDSIARCERLISNYRGHVRFVILHHGQNRGVSAARNSGTAAATGDCVYYLDGDDALPPNSIERLTRPMLNDATIEMALGNIERIPDGYPVASENRQKLQEEELTSLEAVRDYYFSRRMLSVTACNKLIRKVFLEWHQMAFKEGLLYEDNLWSFFMVKHLAHVYIVPEVTYLYYKHPNSITTGTSKEEEVRHYSVVYEEIAQHFTPGEEAREAAYFLPDFRLHYQQFPDNPSFRRTARLFEKALSITLDEVVWQGGGEEPFGSDTLRLLEVSKGSMSLQFQ